LFNDNDQEDPEKKVYYIFLFLKVSQCKLKQKETILKLGNPLKSNSKFTNFKIDWGASQLTREKKKILCINFLMSDLTAH
jgi:hypothetical protein